MVELKVFKIEGITHLSIAIEDEMPTVVPIIIRRANFPTLKPLRVAELFEHNSYDLPIQLPKFVKKPNVFFGIFLDDWVNPDGITYYKAGDMHPCMQLQDFDLALIGDLEILNS